MTEMEMPSECEKCKKKFDLMDDLDKEDMDKTPSQVLKEKMGGRLLCKDCRK